MSGKSDLTETQDGPDTTDHERTQKKVDSDDQNYTRAGTVSCPEMSIIEVCSSPLPISSLSFAEIPSSLHLLFPVPRPPTPGWSFAAIT